MLGREIKRWHLEFMAKPEQDAGREGEQDAKSEKAQKYCSRGRSQVKCQSAPEEKPCYNQNKQNQSAAGRQPTQKLFQIFPFEQRILDG